jgi:hypothetical protein
MTAVMAKDLVVDGLLPNVESVIATFGLGKKDNELSVAQRIERDAFVVSCRKSSKNDSLSFLWATDGIIIGSYDEIRSVLANNM